MKYLKLCGFFVDFFQKMTSNSYGLLLYNEDMQNIFFLISLILQTLLRQTDYNKFIREFVSLQVTALKKTLMFQRGKENTKLPLPSEKE